MLFNLSPLCYCRDRKNFIAFARELGDQAERVIKLLPTVEPELDNASGGMGDLL